MTIVVTTGVSLDSNYASLQDDIANWMARTDLTEEIRRFIMLAESDICKDLRVRGQETEVEFDTSAGSAVLPDGFLGARRVYMDDGTALDYLSPERFHTSKVANLTGTPHAYTIEGDAIKFAPQSPADNPLIAKMLYIKPFEGLVDSNDTNSLLSKSYDVYLYAALMHGFGFVRDNEEAIKCKGQYREIVELLNRNANRERFMNTKLIATGVPTP